MLDDERYAEISRRLIAEGFEPDINDNGNETVQRWRLGDLKVTVDFLMPPADGEDSTRRIHNLEPHFGAVITPGAGIAERLSQHAIDHPEIVARAVEILARDFDTPDDIGPLRAATFIATDRTEFDDDAADAHGYVDDLLRAAARLGLL